MPVVSTPIRDVIRPYGESGMVRITSDVDTFEAACADALAEACSAAARRRQAQADAYLAGLSWDATWQAMQAEMEAAALLAAPSTLLAESADD